MNSGIKKIVYVLDKICFKYVLLSLAQRERDYAIIISCHSLRIVAGICSHMQ